MKRNGKRYCKICTSQLVKNGRYTNGRQRGYCPHCKTSISICRKDITTKLWCAKYLNYVFGNKTQSEYGVHRTTFIRKIKPFRSNSIYIPNTNEAHDVIYIDGIWVKGMVYLIARNKNYVIGFSLVNTETKLNGGNFIKQFREPKYVVCDGQNGMLRAIKQYGPQAVVQRCVFHIGLNMKSKLTLKPDTICGKELLDISKKLLKVNNQEEKNEGINSFRKGETEYHDYVVERTFNTQQEGFTHYRLRSAAYQLKRMLVRGQLFNYLNCVEHDIGKTNNLLEGGINSPLRNLLYKHRGMKFKNQQKLIELYLLKRSEFGAQISHIFAT